MVKYEVGEKYPELIGPEGPLFDLSDAGGIMAIKFDRPTKKEINQFKTGKYKFKFALHNGVVWVLFKAGNLNWMDTPYHAKLSLQLSHFEEPEEGEGLGINVIFLDASNGLIHAIRLVSLTTAQTRWLREQTLRQKAEDDFNVTGYNIKISATMAMMDTEDLLKIAEV